VLMVLSCDPLAIALTAVLPVYGAWRTVRWLAIIAFGVLLITASQLGAAWRGQVQRW
jgi:hypothetical protein